MELYNKEITISMAGKVREGKFVIDRINKASNRGKERLLRLIELLRNRVEILREEKTKRKIMRKRGRMWE